MKEKLIVALDVDSLKSARELIDILYPRVKIFKVGYQLFLKCGWKVPKVIKNRGAKIFLDLKLFDIPNTISKSSALLAKEDIFMFNIHALGGFKMMLEAVRAVKSFGEKRPLIIAVTLLTSFDNKTLTQIGIEENLKEEAIKLAMLAKKAGLDGVVASPKEVREIKRSCGRDFVVVCPGIRPKGVSRDDQKRTSTPAQAISEGADYIVVGRPITQARDPLAAAQKIKEQIESV